jgi:hypothetical protein
VAGAGNVPLYDQRGAPFARVHGGRIDIGAFELQQVGPTLPGDYNQNGTVDAADYVVWRKTLGTTGLPAYSGADGDGDGMVDQDDHGVWRANFGRTLPPLAAGSFLGATLDTLQVAPDPGFLPQGDEAIPVGQARSDTGMAASVGELEFSQQPRPSRWDGARSRLAGQTLPFFAAQQDNAILAWLSSRNEKHDPCESVTAEVSNAAEEREVDVKEVDAVFAALELGVASRARRFTV